MEEPTKAEKDWYVNWYNNLPPATKNPTEKWGLRTICPSCREPVFAKLNEEGDVCIDLKHKDDCQLLKEYNATH